MNIGDKLTPETQRRIHESLIGGIVIGTGVAVERLLHQGTNVDIALTAGSIQIISTFFMALGSISFYDWMVEKFPGELSKSMKKIAVGGSLAILSGLVNYIGQLKTQGSLNESVVMFSLASSGLAIYEFNVLSKVKVKIGEILLFKK